MRFPAPRSLARALMVSSAVLWTACDQPATPAPQTKTTDKPDATPASDAPIWKQFSGERAFEEVRKQVSFGPRPSGSEALEKARVYTEEKLKKHGWDVERQTFRATPVPGRNEIEYTNLIARFSTTTHPAPATTQRAIVCSHNDTKRFLGLTFVGANDSASSSGAMVELARVLATAPTLAEQIELVFFDGEEAQEKYSDINGPDGLVGSRHYSSKLRETDRAKQFKFAILWDMIGDKDLTITLPLDSNKELANGIFSSADALGLRSYFSYYSQSLIDDHKTLEIIAKIPAIDLIDFDYLFWHTGGDTMEKLSPDSLQIVAQVTLHYLVGALAK